MAQENVYVKPPTLHRRNDPKISAFSRLPILQTVQKNTESIKSIHFTVIQEHRAGMKTKDHLCLAFN